MNVEWENAGRVLADPVEGSCRWVVWAQVAGHEPRVRGVFDGPGLFTAARRLALELSGGEAGAASTWIVRQSWGYLKGGRRELVGLECWGLVPFPAGVNLEGVA